MRDPAGEKQCGRSGSKVGRIAGGAGNMKKVAHMVEGHDNDDQAANSVDRPDTVGEGAGGCGIHD